MTPPAASLDGPLRKRAPRELAEIAARCAAGEAEIASTYFVWNKRNRETEVHWLTKQAGRELESTFTLLKGVLRHIGWENGAPEGDWVDQIRDGVDRRWMEDELWKVKQELNHGNYCVNLLEKLTGSKADIREIIRKYNRWNPDPDVGNNTEWCRLAELFREQEARSEPWASVVTSDGLLEGGSCGLFYAASKLDNDDDFDKRIARAFKVVLSDERGHGPANVYRVSEVIKNNDDLEAAKSMLRERALQRLRMRNEQFSHPLPANRLDAMIAGDIDLTVVREIWGDRTYKFVAPDPASAS